MSLQFLEDVYMYHIYRYILQCGVHIYYIQSVTIRSKCQFLCERNIFVQNDFFSHITLPQCIIFCIYFNHKHATIFNDNLLQVIFNFPSFNEFYDRLAISFQDDSLLSYVLGQSQHLFIPHRSAFKREAYLILLQTLSSHLL